MRRNLRRFIGGTVALAVGLSALALTHASAAPAQPQPTLAPPAGQTAVAAGHKVIFGGSIPTGTTLVSAGLRFRDRSGERVSVPDWNTGDLAVEQRTFIGDSGQVTGDKTLPALPPELNDGTVHLVLTVSAGGEEATGISQGVPIDLQRPQIMRYELIEPRKIRVTFTEDVRLPGPLTDEQLNEQLLNWRICNTAGCDPMGDIAENGIFFPTEVTGQGAVRTLHLSVLHQLDQDATPRVWFHVAPKTGYVDRAVWSLDANGRLRTSLDKIAPALPSIDEVAGRTGNIVVANDPTPRVVLTGLRAGHVGQVYLETSSADNGFQVNEDSLLAEAVANSSGRATIDIADDKALPSDGSFILYGVARDRAKCDPSVDGSPECPNHSAGVARSYVLDTLAPRPLFASSDLRDGNGNDPIIRVRFSEPISPDGDAGTWEVMFPGIEVEDVTGSGDERILSVNNLPQGVEVVNVKWTAPAQQSSALVNLGNGEIGYSDNAGNAVASFEERILNGIPPLAVVRTPANHMWTSNNSITLQGTVERATGIVLYDTTGATPIELYRGAEPVRSDGTFRIDWPLTQDRPYRFGVQAYRIQDGATYFGPVSPAPPCGGCSIVHDTIPPQVSVTNLGRALADGSIGFKGGDTATITWAASDANLGDTPVRLEFFNGSTWETLGGGIMSNNPPTFTWLVPAINTESARVRVTVTDQAQLRTTATSNTFIIDSRPPNFTAAMHDATRVDVLFDEPVQASSHPAQATEWSIEDVDPVTGQARKLPAGAAQPIAGQSGMIIGLRLTTGLHNGVPQRLEPNARPIVRYEAPDQNEELLKQVKDRAGNLLQDTVEIAQDLVKPLGPTSVSASRLLTGAMNETLTGAVPQADTRNQVVVRRVSPGAEFLGQVANNGRYSVGIGLVADRAATYEVRVKDQADNISAESVLITLTNDSTAPKVSVRKPGVRRSGKRRFITIKWSSVDAHKNAVTIEFRVKGKSKWARQVRTVVKNTADDGSFVWRAPSWVRGRQIKYYVAAVDQVGNVRQAASRYYSVR